MARYPATGALLLVSRAAAAGRKMPELPDDFFYDLKSFERETPSSELPATTNSSVVRAVCPLLHLEGRNNAG